MKKSKYRILCNCPSCRSRRKRGKFVMSEYECEVSPIVLESVVVSSAPAVVSDASFIHRWDTIEDAKVDSPFLRPGREKKGLYSFYGPHETVGKTLDYTKFRKKYDERDFVDDRSMYW